MFLFRLIQERYLRHCATLRFGIHRNAMPERQRNGGMIAVTNGTAGIHAGIATHHAPAPASRLRIRAYQLLVFLSGNTIGIFRANVDRLAASAVELLHDMRFPAATLKRFIAE